jgi:hypothetical protein
MDDGEDRIHIVRVYVPFWNDCKTGYWGQLMHDTHFIFLTLSVVHTVMQTVPVSNWTKPNR